jgi:hypothetical protein
MRSDAAANTMIVKDYLNRYLHRTQKQMLDDKIQNPLELAT